jgi:transcriptional regulator GlxA family with amidase domain
MSPKAFSRTVRFQHALALMHSNGRDDWAGIAWDCGFADQAHLIREFRGLSGATPTRFREEAVRLAGQFVSRDRLDRYFAG